MTRASGSCVELPTQLGLRLLLPLLFLAVAPPVLANCPLATSVRERTADSAFADNGDGSVTHTGTGLVWKRCLEGYRWTGATCEDDVAVPDTYTWANALGAALHANANPGHATYNPGRHNDWRLPNIKELDSLVETGCAGTGPFINSTWFPATPKAWFWSATTLASDPKQAWDVDFSVGYVETYFKTTPNHVRLVRGGEAYAGFDALRVEPAVQR